VEAAELLDGNLLNIVSDIEAKSARIEKLKADAVAAKHDDRIADLNSRVRAMEEQRENLTLEIRALTLQSDSRAQLTLHQRDLASKDREMKNM
jgi:DNA repair protein RAD50